MLTEKTGAGNNWEQFMRVKTQARMRNAGLGAGKVLQTAQLRSTTKQLESQMSTRSPLAATGTMRSGMYSTPSPVMQNKIVGGKFDAWA